MARDTLLAATWARARRLPYALGASVLIAFTACEESQSARPTEQSVAEVSAGRVVLGLTNGVLRTAANVEGFLISRHPVTRAEYAACVDAGRCAEAACSADEDEQGGGRPVDCVGVKSATQYCAWTRGKLPTLSQWLLAARGELPKRFAWGDERPDCKRHPWAGMSRAARMGAPDAQYGHGSERCVVTPEELLVEAHPASVSPAGLQDVLMTVSELVRGVPETPYGACSEGRTCIVSGLEAGAMDTVEDVEDGMVANSGMGFRCVWEK